MASQGTSEGRTVVEDIYANLNVIRSFWFLIRHNSIMINGYVERVILFKQLLWPYEVFAGRFFLRS